MIGIIGAMTVEVEEIISNIKNSETWRCGEILFHRGILSGVECVVSCCSPGKVNAACCAQMMLLQYRPELILNVGVAGGMGPGVEIGDLVLASGVVQHDMDTTCLGDEPGYLSGLGVIVLPAAEQANRILEEAAHEAGFSGTIHRGIVATGDQFIADAERLHEIRAKFQACACEMEGGAIAQACFINGVPCAVVRSISDNADSNAKVDFPRFAVQAAHSTTALLCKAMKGLAAAFAGGEKAPV